MQISSRFTIATHVLVVLALEGEQTKVTSDYLAASVGVNPVIIRNVLSQLKAANLIAVTRGKGGARVVQNLSDITLYDIYEAVDSLGKSGQLFGFHDNPNPNCNIGRTIHAVLDGRLEVAQRALEAELNQTTLADLVQDAQEKSSI
ncbi:Rrf2 family transcriptional regulator [Streptococcus sp. zg-86]|uniref:Rrf2 family transcriptional regulator n=1 Tax=Streptococcus zhangguiae TaxID=2664091 RepID=A0A6I4RBS4_9STRE|nr:MULTISPECIES: Rrf2 family transcriptional regulator [unclassified Streptococcus]MTB64171.1 Rrf2 family transcriptional regulator [Streptococcus sp. zg-86]MTB90503.1 Rrf2 family transcriptional regulator [Streptococcus sp. zg-36]MWV56158.1 Rrf2 family transcriptional regulator [Streptococcus sp. zg-70]QTH48220.1 Rrf2 family transcriptional regulator [Streptococcus sp. zg-86]